MLKIRLKRVGRKHDPSYRVVLIDSKLGPKSGKINEILGFYDPKKNTKELKTEEIRGWISKGAQVSDTVHNLLIDQNVIEGRKKNVLPRKSPIVKEEERREEPKEEAAPVANATSESGAPTTESTPVEKPIETEAVPEPVVEEKTEESEKKEPSEKILAKDADPMEKESSNEEEEKEGSQ